MNTDIKILIELIEAAVNSNKPRVLLKIFNGQLINGQSQELRNKVNNLIARELNLDSVVDLNTAKETISKLSKVDKSAFFKLISNYLK